MRPQGRNGGQRIVSSQLRLVSLERPVAPAPQWGLHHMLRTRVTIWAHGAPNYGIGGSQYRQSMLVHPSFLQSAMTGTEQHQTPPCRRKPVDAVGLLQECQSDEVFFGRASKRTKEMFGDDCTLRSWQGPWVEPKLR